MAHPDQLHVKLMAWMNRSELRQVYAELYSDNILRQKHALGRIDVWKSRSLHKLPLALESTATLVQAKLAHQRAGPSIEDDRHLRTLYSMAILRFVNHVTEKGQGKQYAQPVHLLAANIGVPEWIVDLRHEAAHGDLPPLVSLRAAANWALHWLKVEYWEVQKQGTYRQELQHIGDLDMRKDTLRDLLVEFQQRRFKEPTSKPIVSKILADLISKVIDESEKSVAKAKHHGDSVSEMKIVLVENRQTKEHLKGRRITKYEQQMRSSRAYSEFHEPLDNYYEIMLMNGKEIIGEEKNPIINDLIKELDTILFDLRGEVYGCLTEDGYLVSTKEQLSAVGINVKGMKKGSKLSLSPKMAKFWKPIMKLLNKHGLLTEFLPHLVSEITCKTSLRNSQLCAWILKLIPSKTHGIYIKDFDFDCPSFKKLLKNCVLLESPYATKLINKLKDRIPSDCINKDKILMLQKLNSLYQGNEENGRDTYTENGRVTNVENGRDANTENERDTYSENGRDMNTENERDTNTELKTLADILVLKGTVGCSGVHNNSVEPSADSDNTWRLCTEIDDWSKYPIGVLPNQTVTYRNLELFRDEDDIEDVAMETEEFDESIDDTEDLAEDIDENVDAGVMEETERSTNENAPRVAATVPLTSEWSKETLQQIIRMVLPSRLPPNDRHLAAYDKNV